MTPTPNIGDVRAFWERNPLWSGESAHQPGTAAFYAEHDAVYVADCFAGRMDERIFPSAGRPGRVLDLGCGPGFWTVQLGRRGFRHLVGCDLTAQAARLARGRCEIAGLHASFAQGNAEQLGFASGVFSHVNCLGVIHHTPNTAEAVREIARVLGPGGTATLAVYYTNVLLRAWPVFGRVGALLVRLGVGLSGRGRERMLASRDIDDIVRQYDGAENPIGTAYTRGEFMALLAPHFHVREVYYHSFPARALGIPMPQWIHRMLSRLFPFMIYASVEKR